MCDTMGFFHEGSAIFAKNSDRSPNEPQVLEYIPAKDHEETELKVTYTTVPQVPHTKAVLISRPVWLWGAEMGVNEDGVCIGNEAVFTKGAYHKEVYGQGGNCAYDHKFYYDNSYLIMDRHHIFILETADKEWTCEEVDRGSISNRLSQDKAFARKHKDPVYSTFSGSGDRLKQSSTCLVGATSVQDMMKALRTHAPGVKNPFAEGTVNSVCMHFGGVVGDHSTSSMIVELKDDIEVWVTGTSTPCVSLFKPYRFGDVPTTPIYEENDPAAEAYWRNAELFRRTLLCHELPPEFYAERDALEADFLIHKDSKAAAEADKAFYDRWSAEKLKKVPSSYQFRNRWAKKTKVLKDETK